MKTVIRLIRSPHSRTFYVVVPTSEGMKRISTGTASKEAAKAIGATLHLLAKQNEGKQVTKVN